MARTPRPRVLRPEDLLPDPLDQFRLWFDEAGRTGVRSPETMVLATATPDGAPSARAVLLKDVDEAGLRFFTNHRSRKGLELAANPRAALVFLWDVAGRQVRVEGRAERLPREEAEAYFRARPFGSRIGAWASPQSEVVPGRETFEGRAAELEAEYAGREDELPLPPDWGGYLLVPEAFEFWQHRANRLHDRFRYRRSGDGWTVERLAP